MLLSIFARRYLPRSEGRLRAGEPLGANRREAIFRGWQYDDKIEVRGVDIRTGKRLRVGPTDWVGADFAIVQLIKTDWEPIGDVEVRFAPHEVEIIDDRDRLLLAAFMALGRPERASEKVWDKARADNRDETSLSRVGTTRARRRILAAAIGKAAGKRG